MIISFYRTAITLILIAVLSGCSWFGKNEPEYVASVEHEFLKIPSGLSEPAGPAPVIISAPQMRKPAGDELEPPPPRVASTAGKEQAKAYMSWSAQGVYLLVKDTPENVVQSLRLVIEQDGMQMLQASESGSHKFHYTQSFTDDAGFFSNMAFWRDRPLDFSGTFMTSVSADGKNTRVYLLFGTGEAVDTAGSEHVLGIFMDRLG